MKQKKQGNSRFAANIILACILVLGLYLSLGFFYGPSWTNGSDDYIYAQAGRAYSVGNFTDKGVGTIHIRYLLYAGIAIFVKIIGYSQLSLSMFGVFAFIMTVLLIYLIGKRLCNVGTGLIAAFTYAIFPLVAIQAPIVGDVVPMTFFLTLAVFLVIEGMSRRKQQYAFFAIAGIVSLVNFLVSPEALIGALFLAVVMGLYFAYYRDRRSGACALSYFAGAAAGVGIILLISLLHTGSILYLFRGEDLASLGIRSPSFGVFTQFMFPNNLISKTLTSSFVLSPSMPNLVLLFQEYANLGPTAEFKFFGFFGYAAVLCLAYLLIAKEKRAIIPALWLAITLIYLGYGSQGISSYAFIVPYARYEVIFAPAIALIVGMALMRIIEFSKANRGYTGFACMLFVDIVLLTLLVTSASTIRSFGLSEYYGTHPLVQIGSYLDALPDNALIVGPADVPWITYVNSQHSNTISTGPIMLEETCAEIQDPFGKDIPNGTYFVGPASGNFSACGFREVYEASAPVGWTSPYDLYWAMNFYNVSVYRKAA